MSGNIAQNVNRHRDQQLQTIGVLSTMVERFFAFEDDDRIAKVLPLLVISAKELVTVIYSQPEARIRISLMAQASMLLDSARFLGVDDMDYIKFVTTHADDRPHMWHMAEYPLRGPDQRLPTLVYDIGVASRRPDWTADGLPALSLREMIHYGRLGFYHLQIEGSVET